MSYYVPTPGTFLSRDIADYPEGIVLPVDKPWRWTSADVIRKVKYAAIRHFGKKNLKVGHAGTLDPLATGVLLVCIGPACREAQHLQDTDKEYLATVRFGATTPSYDLEKEVDRRFPYEHITAEAVAAALPAFLGEQEQVAPLFSAKSVDGVRAYEMARKLYRAGDLASLDAAALSLLQRNVIRISALTLESFASSSNMADIEDEDAKTASLSSNIPQNEDGSPIISNSSSKMTENEDAPAKPSPSGRIHFADTGGLGLPEARIRIACSKGTYIRSFARDLGEALGSGAHLGGLVRTRSGSFRVEDALTLDQVINLLKHE